MVDLDTRAPKGIHHTNPQRTYFEAFFSVGLKKKWRIAIARWVQDRLRGIDKKSRRGTKRAPIPNNILDRIKLYPKYADTMDMKVREWKSVRR